MDYSRITIRFDQMGGAPCIRGLRIPVSVVLGMLAEMTREDILKACPDLEEEDFAAALKFAASVLSTTKNSPLYTEDDLDDFGEILKEV